MVMPPANTGNDNTNSIEVIKTDQTNKGILKNLNASGLIFTIVTIMLIEPKIEETPAKCTLKIAKSTDGPACPIKPLKGG
jgi:hypothetical protein